MTTEIIRGIFATGVVFEFSYMVVLAIEWLSVKFNKKGECK